MKIALVGNPNSGKTTLFNELTGSNQYVGNWPGVTVEKKEGKLKKYKDITIVDLPGIYSLSPYTMEEVISRNYLVDENPDLILNIIDGSNIERNLYLTTQILDLNIPTIIACNMMDVVEKNKNTIDFEGLTKELGVRIIPISAANGSGLSELINSLFLIKDKPKDLKIFSEDLQEILDEIEKGIENKVSSEDLKYYSIKIFERDEKIAPKFLDNNFENIIASYENKINDDSESIITSERYDYITKLISKYLKKSNTNTLTVSDKIDKIVTNRFLAIPIFVLVMWIVYYVSVTTVGTIVTDWTNDVLFGEIVPPLVTSFLESINTSSWLIGLIVEGIVGGVGAVIGFVPQMLILFMFLAILEDCGYMARIAFIMDRIFRKFGLSGKSFIPMIIGTGCSVPAIMASRTIENDRDRKMTITTTSFIPCGAKLPVIALIAGALFNDAGWVGTSAYFIGVIAIIISGIILKKTSKFSGDPAPFVMELPAYHLPRIKNVLKSMWERGSSFIKKAGTVILLASIVIWFLQNFGFVGGQLSMVEDMENSILANIGNIFAPIFNPLGWGNWKAAVATITGLVAKEGIISTLGVLYGIAIESEEGIEIWGTFAEQFNVISGYSFLIFNLLCAPCFAAIGAIKREMNNTKWTLFAIAYQTIFAYVMAFIFYQIGMYFYTNSFSFYTIIAVALAILIIFLLVRPYNKNMK